MVEALLQAMMVRSDSKASQSDCTMHDNKNANGGQPQTMAGLLGGTACAAAPAAAAASKPAGKKKVGIPWTTEEHKRFLVGLSALGKGDWRGISRHYVQTRTPTQVASHAQKYYIRQTSGNNKRKRRQSLFDTTLDTIPETSDAIMSGGLNGSVGHNGNGCTDDDGNKPSVSPRVGASPRAGGHLRAHAPAAALPTVAMPVGILAKGKDGEDAYGDADGAMNALHPYFPFMNGAMLPSMASLDPSSLLLMSNRLMQAQSFPSLFTAHIPSHPSTALSSKNVCKPMAVRYTENEVQQFKAEWTRQFSPDPPSVPPAPADAKLGAQATQQQQQPTQQPTPTQQQALAQKTDQQQLPAPTGAPKIASKDPPPAAAALAPLAAKVPVAKLGKAKKERKVECGSSSDGSNGTSHRNSRNSSQTHMLGQGQGDGQKLVEPFVPVSLTKGEPFR